MCGILAVLNFGDEPVDKDLTIRMRDTMYHRGPDGAGVYCEGPVALAHRRLAIIDLSESGRQPMTNDEQTIFLVCNGEIYNYVELMEELKKRGHTFQSSSDSETIIHQYEEDGERCLEKFNGMFSFVLWDSRQKKLFAARDRLGIKPLYYYADDKRIILSSEIKAIIEDPSVPRKPDYEGISDYLFASRPLGNKTTFLNIKELEPGQMLTASRNTRSFHVKRYWEVSYNYNHSRTKEKLKDELFSLFDDVVKVHCRSDASLGCHLSGGLDSSTIVAFASRHRKSLKTFSIKFSDDDFIDETRYAKAVARHVGAEYHESSPCISETSMLLPFLAWHLDVPSAATSAFAYYAASRLAAKHVKVSLTGHGGDEIFAGYPGQLYASFNVAKTLYKYDPGYKFGPHAPMSSSIIRKIKAVINKGPLGIYGSLKNKIFKPEKNLEDIWVKGHTNQLPKDNIFLQRGFLKALHGYSPLDDYLRPFKDVNTDQAIDKCLFHDLRLYLPSLLHLEDRVSMAVSIESRVPMLDYRLVEFLATVPPEQKINLMEPKYLLKEIGSSLLPEEIINRKDKFTFPVPAKFWLTDDMKALIKKVLLSAESMERGIFKPQKLKNICASDDLGAILPILNLELWFKIFIEKDPYWLALTRLQ